MVVMELMPNGSLDEVVRLVHEGRPPPRWDATARSKAVLGMIAGMAFVHSLGLVHGSLDPIHILLDSDFEVRIASFGCSALGGFHLPLFRSLLAVPRTGVSSRSFASFGTARVFRGPACTLPEGSKLIFDWRWLRTKQKSYKAGHVKQERNQSRPFQG
jgi:serine/threonine protein kinase